MATAKVTMFFMYTAGNSGSAFSPTFNGKGGKAGGWSESWYTDVTPGSTQMDTAIGRLCQTRCGILSSSIAIWPVRVQSVDPLGPAFLLDRIFNPSGTSAQDLPQVSLTQRVRGQTTRNRFTVELRGLPDARVVNGVYVSSQTFNNALDAYFTELRNWAFRGQDFTAETKPVQSVAADGTYILAAAGAFVSGQKVKVLRTKNTSGRQVSQVCTVAVTDATHGILVGWKQGICVGGNMRLVSFTYQTPRRDDQDFVVASTRKVGRPSQVFRGKVSRRRS